MKEIIADLAAKWGMFIFNTMDKIKNTTGIDVEKRMIKSMKKDEKMREEHPFRWALKNLTFGALKGLFDAGTHSISK